MATLPSTWRCILALFIAVSGCSAQADNIDQAQQQVGPPDPGAGMGVLYRDGGPMGPAAFSDAAGMDRMPFAEGGPMVMVDGPKTFEGGPMRLDAGMDTGTSGSVCGPLRSSALSPASGLRSRLTWLMQENVLLSGLAIKAVATQQVRSQSAELALDENTVGLADVVRRVYGRTSADQFREIWRAYAQAFLSYGQARAGGDERAAQQAIVERDQALSSLSTWFARLHPLADRSTVEQALRNQSATFQTAVDAIATDDPTQYTKLDQASDAMSAAAFTLSGVYKERAAGAFAGSVASAGSSLRGALTNHLVLQSYLQALASWTVLNGGNPGTAMEVLQADTAQMTQLLQGRSDTPADAQLQKLWNAQLGYLSDYARALAAGDLSGEQQAIASLRAFTRDVSAELRLVDQDFEPTTIEHELDQYVSSLLAVIDAQATGDRSQFHEARMAGAEAFGAARSLAMAIAGPEFQPIRMP